MSLSLSMIHRMLLRRGARGAYLLYRSWLRIRRPITVGVRGLVVDRRGHILVVRHSYVPGWHLPGGGLDRGETTAEALRRELVEETGLTAAGPLPLFGLFGRFENGVSDHVAVHLVRDWHGDLTVDGREILDARFICPAQPEEILTPGTARRVREFLNGETPGQLW